MQVTPSARLLRSLSLSLCPFRPCLGRRRLLKEAPAPISDSINAVVVQANCCRIGAGFKLRKTSVRTATQECRPGPPTHDEREEGAAATVPARSECHSRPRRAAPEPRVPEAIPHWQRLLGVCCSLLDCVYVPDALATCMNVLHCRPWSFENAASEIQRIRPWILLTRPCLCSGPRRIRGITRDFKRCFKLPARRSAGDVPCTTTTTSSQSPRATPESKCRAKQPQASCRPGLGRLRPFLRQEPVISQAQDTPKPRVCFNLERLKWCVLAINRDWQMMLSAHPGARTYSTYLASDSLKFGNRVLLGFGVRRNCPQAGR